MNYNIEELTAERLRLKKTVANYRARGKHIKAIAADMALARVEAQLWDAELQLPLMEVEEIHSEECAVEGHGRLYAKQGSVSRVRYSDPADPKSWEVL